MSRDIVSIFLIARFNILRSYLHISFFRVLVLHEFLVKYFQPPTHPWRVASSSLQHRYNDNPSAVRNGQILCSLCKCIIVYVSSSLFLVFLWYNNNNCCRTVWNVNARIFWYANVRPPTSQKMSGLRSITIVVVGWFLQDEGALICTW